MDSFWGLSGTTWTAIYTLLTALLLITAWVAAVIAWGQWKASRDAVRDARHAQAEASRPYILVTAEASEGNRRLFDLSIRNIGKRPALDIHVQLDPPPTRAKEVDGHEFANMKMLNEPIVMLAPEQEMRAFWDSHLDRHDVDLPTAHRVHLTYTDSSSVTYEESSMIDLDAMQGSIYAEVKTLHDVGKSLEEIKKVLKRAALMSRHGSIDVRAVTEPYEAHQVRLTTEEYHRLRKCLEPFQGQRKNHPEFVTSLEKRIARMEAEHPFLVTTLPSSRPPRFSRITSGLIRQLASLRSDLIPPQR